MYTHALFGVMLGLGLHIVPVAAQERHAEIEAINAAWNHAYHQGNTSALADLYTEDAVLVPPSDKMISGLAEVEKFWRTLIWSGVTARETKVARVETTGDTAFTTGTWEGTGPSRDGTWTAYRGNFVRVLERQPDGTWKTRLHSWNIIPN